MKFSLIKSSGFRWMAVGVIVAAVVCVVLLWRSHPAPLPAPEHLEPQALARALASDRFAKLSDEQKVPYARALIALDPTTAANLLASLPPQQQNAAFEQVGYVVISQMSDGYHEQKTPQQRRAYLDHVLDLYDSIEQAGKRTPRLAGVSSQEAIEAADQRRQIAKDWMVRGLGPSQSAQMAEFYKALVLRRLARHLPMYGW